jgi:murein DD-endopeptidase MepM/ murein hydrolase activator NlpD
MDQQYFVIELAHSVHGQAKRIRLSYKFLMYVVVSALFVSLFAVGAFAEYVRMSREVSEYKQLQTDFQGLRARYQQLERTLGQHNEQMASLETLASEVSVAYGISGPPAPPSSRILQPESLGGVKECFQEYNFLKAASYSGIFRHYAHAWQAHNIPSLWPVNGILRSSFGGRSDPFSGEGTFHTGVDLEAAVGTPVHVTADGVVTTAGWSGAYGKLVIVDHGNGIETYYAHLSQFLVVPGEEVERGQVLALSGGTGRVTGPHMHYEVRLHGTPVNPYKYLVKSQPAQAASSGHSDLGL